jgi:hypothetical protein
MTLTDCLAAGAIAMGVAAGAPSPKVAAHRYVWHVAQDAGVPDSSPSSAGDAGAAEQRAAELARALLEYEQAQQRRKDSQP